MAAGHADAWEHSQTRRKESKTGVRTKTDRQQQTETNPGSRYNQTDKNRQKQTQTIKERPGGFSERPKDVRRVGEAQGGPETFREAQG